MPRIFFHVFIAAIRTFKDIVAATVEVAIQKGPKRNVMNFSLGMLKNGN